MLVRIVAGQRLDPVWPEDSEQSETAAQTGNRPDPSNLENCGLIPGVVGERLRRSCLSTACEHYYLVPLSSGVMSINLVLRDCSRPLVATKLSIRAALLAATIRR